MFFSLLKHQRSSINLGSGEPPSITQLFEVCQRTLVPAVRSLKIAQLPFDIAQTTLFPGRSRPILELDENSKRLFRQRSGSREVTAGLIQKRKLAERLRRQRVIIRLLGQFESVPENVA